MAAKIEVKVSQHFSASAEKVYDAWLNPDMVRVWLRNALKSMGLSGEIAQIKMIPEVGGAFLFSDMRDGTEARHWGTYLDLEYPRKIAFTWNTPESDEFDPNKVIVTIQPDGDGCVATVVNEFDANWADYVALTEKAWGSMMKAMDELLAK